jgi:hypothetical protein
MPDFRHKRMIATYARYIVRHGLLTWREIDLQTMTLKLHKVAQSGLRRTDFCIVNCQLAKRRVLIPSPYVFQGEG